MELLEIWKGDAERSYVLVQAMPREENGFENKAQGMSRKEYAEELIRLEDESAGRNLAPGRVAATKFLIVNDEGDYVGILNLRHELTPALAQGAGHIGYAVAPSWRGRGYATEALGLALRMARVRYGIGEAYLSVGHSRQKGQPESIMADSGCPGIRPKPRTSTSAGRSGYRLLLHCLLPGHPFHRCRHFLRR